MKLGSLLAAACCLLFVCSAFAQTASTEAPGTGVETRAKVMVLGVYHFTPGGSDYIKNRLDDHLSPRRQAEIAQVLGRLERFRPTKIALELDPAGEARFNERYRRWLAGEGELGVNERDQLGMALARRLGHDRLYSADASSDMHFDEMLAAARAAGQNHLVQRFHADIAALEAQQAATRGLSVRDRLIAVNSPEYVRLNGSDYLTMAQMGTRDNPVALRDMTAWLARNLSIFAQVGQLSEPGDRILLIYGAGHKFLLDQYFGQARECPAFVGDVVCELSRTKSIVVALELDEEDQRATEEYLLSDGNAADRDMLLAAEIWRSPSQYGTTSVAMVGLIERLRLLKQSGRTISVVHIRSRRRSGAAPQHYHELGMASRLADAALANPSALVVGLMGNVHARKDVIPRLGNLRPAAAHLPSADVVSLNYSSSGGKAWQCRRSGCGVHELPALARLPRGIRLFSAPQNGFDGEFSVGAEFTPSPPANSR